MRKFCSVAMATMLFTGLAASAQAQQRGNMTAEERAQRQAAAERERQEMMRMPRPIEALNSIWIDELTWLEVRDLMADGHTTAIVPTGGIEQNGPYLANGKHNYVLQGACDGIARKLGNALCTPVLKLVPEGDPENIRYPGTLSLRQETFQAVLEDVSNSLKSQGFTDVFLIGDSGGNQQGLAAAAAALNEHWAGSDATAYFIPEYYNYGDVLTYMEEELGYVETVDDGHHDDYYITTLMMVTDPTAVRYHQRVAADEATINGLSITPIHQALEIGKRLMEFRVNVTVAAIEAAMSGSSSTQQ
ncbi:MAG: creatininase family protein [Gemmatimonadetes bacterium]|nr:creatininase family protein [Gemmatimonadota bacterium]